jgi:hypothetical protein
LSEALDGYLQPADTQSTMVVCVTLRTLIGAYRGIGGSQGASMMVSLLCFRDATQE